MNIWFHGTTKENAELIKQNGFQVGTYFGKHLEDAIHMGGGYVFEVLFEENPTEYWEYRNGEVIPPLQIRSLIFYNPELVWHNRDGERRVKIALVREQYDDQTRMCEECDGRGQEEYYPPLVRWRNIMKVTSCKVCNGHGVVYENGEHPYEHGREAVKETD